MPCLYGLPVIMVASSVARKKFLGGGQITTEVARVARHRGSKAGAWERSPQRIKGQRPLQGAGGQNPPKIFLVILHYFGEF